MESFSLRNRYHQQKQQKPPTTPFPRPAPLRVSSNSHKINKPPSAPAPDLPAANRPPQRRPQRRPVIIYAVSPKVIHAKPSEFMSIVQRLTGVNSSPSAAAAPLSPQGFSSPVGAISPAAKLAATERAQHPPDHSIKLGPLAEVVDIIDRNDADGSESSTMAFASSSFTGILSPNPASLPGISPNLFSTGAELSSLRFLQDTTTGFSPTVNNSSGRNFADSTFLTSPDFGLTPTFHSPVNWGLFNL